MRPELRALLATLLVPAVLGTATLSHAQDADPHAGDPHGGDPHAAGGMPQGPPPDGARPDPGVPHGSIVVELLDGDGRPVPRAEVTVGVLVSSVAQGDRRSRVSAETDDAGIARFDKLETGLGVAYRVSVAREGATFAAPPFNMPPSSGMRAQLHVYPVVRDVEQAVIVSQGMLYAEVKDDRVQVQQAFRVYNFGKSAWVPDDLVLELPPDFTGFATQQGMNDITLTAVPKRGVAVRGTFPPGQHVVEYRWQKPYSGEAEVRLEAGVFPHSAALQVVAPASRQMTLAVEGFGAPEARPDPQGQRMLSTERQFRREDPPVRTLNVTIGGLPTEGPGKLLATLVSAGAIAFGLVLGTRKPERRVDMSAEREKLLQALADLEKAHAKGDVGPKTYARARREILDALARTLAAEQASVSEAPRPRKKRRVSA